eukprot:GDKJ01025712.1.p1 GENE.GDKJ01025712.1~~GDKJ01025712.1.p1  ORF type:complete len:676 (+),score=187.62 GDKJ01025712.1:21-2048(+)
MAKVPSCESENEFLESFESNCNNSRNTGLDMTYLGKSIARLLNKMVRDDRFDAWLSEARQGAHSFVESSFYTFGCEPKDKPFASYVPMKLIHTGFQSTVFLLTAETLRAKFNRQDIEHGIVLKFIQKDKLEGEDELQHAREEVRFLETVQHPFLVGLLCAFETSLHIAMATPHASHGELGRRLRNRTLPEREARSLAFQILIALKHLHANGIVHCDVKPENMVLFAARGRDFLDDVLDYASPFPECQSSPNFLPRRSALDQNTHRFDCPLNNITATSSNPLTTESYESKMLTAVVSSTNATASTTMSDSQQQPFANHSSSSSPAVSSILQFSPPSSFDTCSVLCDGCSFCCPLNAITPPSNASSQSFKDEKFLVVKLVDFGLSRLVSRSATNSFASDSPPSSPSLPVTSPSLISLPPPPSSSHRPIKFCGVRGTHGFIAPEILKTEDYDEKIDLWALGVILFSALVGYEPFFPASACLKTKLQIEKEYWSSISPHAADLVTKLLESSPSKRISAADALRHSWFSETGLEFAGENGGDETKRMMTERVGVVTVLPQRLKTGVASLAATSAPSAFASPSNPTKQVTLIQPRTTGNIPSSPSPVPHYPRQSCALPPPPPPACAACNALLVGDVVGNSTGADIYKVGDQWSYWEVPTDEARGGDAIAFLDVRSVSHLLD